MKRFENQDLGAKPRIAVMSNDAIGAYVTTTSLLQMVRAKYPDCELWYFGGDRVKEFAEKTSLFDKYYSLLGTGFGQWMKDIGKMPQFDLVINTEQMAFNKLTSALLTQDHGFVCGPCAGHGGRVDLPFEDGLRGKLWEDREWVSSHVMEKYPFLRSGWIVEIFARLAYLEGPVPGYDLPCADPGMHIPEVLFNTGASLDNKLWTLEKWAELAKRLNAEGVRIGLIGAPPKQGAIHWKGGDVDAFLVEKGLVEDLRGKFTLPQVVGAIDAAKHVVTIDNGILHISAFRKTSVTGLFRNDINRLWAPPAPNVTALTPPVGKLPADIEVDTVFTSWKQSLCSK